jgi:hypothetical protein
MSFAGSQPSSIVDHVPALVSGMISDATPVTVTFANVTDRVTVMNTTTSGTTSLQVAMSVASLAGASSISLGTGESITIEARMKAITVKMISGSSLNYAVVATLNRIEAGEFPALTTANGFEKV